jgi:heptosyltransferase I
MPHRILIVRLSAIGDTILNMPILCALRRHFPDAEIGWVAGKGGAELLHGHEHLDRLFVLGREEHQSPRAYWRFAMSLRAWKPHVVIEAQGLTKSAALGWLSGASCRIGLAQSEFEGREFSTWLNNTIVTPHADHVVDRGLELLRPLGIETPKVEFGIPSPPQVHQRVQHQIGGMGLEDRWAMLNVGAGWVSKLWPSARYAEVARHLRQRWQMPSVILWGGEKEKLAAEAVVAASDGAAVMAPSTSLPEMAAWIRQAALFVGSDTGPMHLAAALDIPTVALIGPMAVERVGPRGPLHAAIQKDRLPESLRHRRKTECGPMLSIASESVCNACDAVLARREQHDSQAA